MTESILSPLMGAKPDAAMVCKPSALKFMLESRMPFVVPVVPPEYRMDAPSSGFWGFLGRKAFSFFPLRRKSFHQM